MKIRCFRHIPLLGIFALWGCTTDGGYDPSTKYDTSKVDYIVSYNTSYEPLPECTEKLEGKVFCIDNTLELFVCVENFWSPKGVIDADDKRLDDAEIYREGSTTPNSSSSKTRITYSVSSFVDQRDGRTYKTVIVDNMEWMAENLDYDNGASRVSTKCSNELGAENCRMYKIVYNIGEDGSSIDDVCPEGFRVPSEYDWEALSELFGGEYEAGAALKDKSFKQSRDYPALDAISFSALATGYIKAGYECYVGEKAVFLVRSRVAIQIGAYDDGIYVVHELPYTTDGTDLIWAGIYNAEDLFSIRCMRDVW